MKLYAKFDIEVVSALLSTVLAYKNKPPMGEVRKALLEAAKTRFQDINYSIDALPPKPPVFISWFEPKDLVDQTAVAAQTTSAVAAGSAEAHASVKVLAFDPESGNLLTEQVTFENKKDVKKQPIELPWKAWYQQHVDVGQTLVDKAAIASMLENLHRQWDVSAVEVQMMSDAGKIYLVAGADMPATSLMLPACSKGFKVHDVTNLHPGCARFSICEQRHLR